MSRRLAALAAALLLTVSAGCGVVTSPPDDDVGPTAEETTGGNGNGDGNGGGNGTPRIELAGLPIGGEQFVLVDEAWCGEAFLQTTPPDGVEVTITDVAATAAGVVDVGCPGSASCSGTTLDAGGSGCTVAVRPDSPTAETVDVVFTAYATCATEEACEAYRDALGESAVWTMSAPEGWPVGSASPGTDEGTDDGTDDGTDGETDDGTDGDGETDDGTDGETDGGTDTDDDGDTGGGSTEESGTS